jgi:hypothetical protein
MIVIAPVLIIPRKSYEKGSPNSFLHTGYIFLFFCEYPISPNGRPYGDFSLAEASKMSPEDVDLLPSMTEQPPMSQLVPGRGRIRHIEEVPVANKEAV